MPATLGPLERPPAPRASEHDLEVDVLRTADALAAVAEPWNRLAGDVPFCRWEWLESWWRHFGRPSDELCVVAVREPSGTVVGLAPWYCRRSPVFGRVLRSLGDGDVCSDYVSVLCAAGDEQRIARRLADWLARDARRLWHAAELQGVAADDAAAAALCHAAAQRGLAHDRRTAARSWAVPLPADWDLYVAGLSKTRRERVRQLCRRQLDTGRAVVRTATTAAERERGFAVLRELHQKRRGAVGHAGCFARPRFERFLRETAERFLDLARLRLQWIEIEGRPAAVEFDLLGGETLYYYQSGIDPDLSDERPGWLGTIAAVRWAISEGYRTYDFLRGDEQYKSHWRAEPRPLSTIRLVGSRRTAAGRDRLWRAAAAARVGARAGLRRIGLRRNGRG